MKQKFKRKNVFETKEKIAETKICGKMKGVDAYEMRMRKHGRIGDVFSQRR